MPVSVQALTVEIANLKLEVNALRNEVDEQKVEMETLKLENQTLRNEVNQQKTKVTWFMNRQTRGITTLTHGSEVLAAVRFRNKFSEATTLKRVEPTTGNDPGTVDIACHTRVPHA